MWAMKNLREMNKVWEMKESEGNEKSDECERMKRGNESENKDLVLK